MRRYMWYMILLALLASQRPHGTAGEHLATGVQPSCRPLQPEVIVRHLCMLNIYTYPTKMMSSSVPNVLRAASSTVEGTDTVARSAAGSLTANVSLSRS